MSELSRSGLQQSSRNAVAAVRLVLRLSHTGTLRVGQHSAPLYACFERRNASGCGRIAASTAADVPRSGTAMSWYARVVSGGRTWF